MEQSTAGGTCSVVLVPSIYNNNINPNCPKFALSFPLVREKLSQIESRSAKNWLHANRVHGTIPEDTRRTEFDRTLLFTISTNRWLPISFPRISVSTKFQDQTDPGTPPCHPIYRLQNETEMRISRQIWTKWWPKDSSTESLCRHTWNKKKMLHFLCRKGQYSWSTWWRTRKMATRINLDISNGESSKDQTYSKNRWYQTSSSTRNIFWMFFLPGTRIQVQKKKDSRWSWSVWTHTTQKVF